MSKNNDNCSTCKRLVAEDEEALWCDNCEIWTHRTCLNMSKMTYKKWEKSTAPWLCNLCMKKKHPGPGLNTKASGSNNNYSNNDIMAKLLEMDSKYNELFKKYEEQLTENQTLRKEVHEIRRKLNAREQEELNNNVIVQGIEFKESEKLDNLVQKLTTILQVPNNILGATRLGEKQQGKKMPIKITFRCAEDKKCWMIAKKGKQLKATDLGMENGNENIYINHDMTKWNIQLFKAAKEFKKNNGYKYLWFSNGKILMRKSDTSKIELIEDESSLKN